MTRAGSISETKGINMDTSLIWLHLFGIMGITMATFHGEILGITSAKFSGKWVALIRLHLVEISGLNVTEFMGNKGH